MTTKDVFSNLDALRIDTEVLWQSFQPPRLSDKISEISVDVQNKKGILTGLKFRPSSDGKWYMPKMGISLQHHSHTIVYAKKITSNGVTFYCRVCSGCGVSFDKDDNPKEGAFWLKNIDVPEEIRSSNLPKKGDIIRPLEDFKYNVIGGMSQLLERSIFWDFYNQYIKSPEWYALNDRVRSIHGGMCKFHDCTRASEEVHHLSYRRLGHENEDELIPLCRYHHGFISRMDSRPGQCMACQTIFPSSEGIHEPCEEQILSLAVVKRLLDEKYENVDA